MKSISRETVQRLYKWDPQAAIGPDLNNYDPALSVEKNLNNARKTFGGLGIALAMPVFAPLQAIKKVLGDNPDVSWSEIGRAQVAPLLWAGAIIKDVADAGVHRVYQARAGGDVYDSK